MSGLEQNPGPAQQTLEDHPVEDWELAELTEKGELKTNRTKCAVCGVGDLRPNVQGYQSMIIYTRNGSKRVKHVPMRCNSRIPSAERIMGMVFIKRRVTRYLKTMH